MPTTRATTTSSTSSRLFQVYSVASALLAVLAIVSAPILTDGGVVEKNACVVPPKKEPPALLRLFFKPPTPPVCDHTNTNNNNYAGLHLLDQNLFTVLYNTDSLGRLLEKIESSNVRLLVLANFGLALALHLYRFVVYQFLGTNNRHNTTHTEKVSGFLFFKLMLISAVSKPDTFDWCIMLCWYTILYFLNALSVLCSNVIHLARNSGQAPHTGVWKLLCCVLVSHIVSSVVNLGLFHEAGLKMLILLNCDCLLLFLQATIQLLKYFGALIEFQHNEQLNLLEERQLTAHRNRQAAVSQEMELQMELLDQNYAFKDSWLNSFVHCLSLSEDVITIIHYVHIWCLHGVKFALIDGVLALHLHSAISSASKKIAERRNMKKISRDMHVNFENATTIDLQKAAANQDVCCICLGSISCFTNHVKKLSCNHLYHTSCLRSVVELARPMEAARCPLCRAEIIRRNEEEPLVHLRFSTDDLFPSWVPVPRLTFEIARRPQPEQPNWLRHVLLMIGAISMNRAEEQTALETLQELFPQYERNDLLRSLRDRGSVEGVTDSIALGTFVGQPRLEAR